VTLLVRLRRFFVNKIEKNLSFQSNFGLLQADN
jgi:hypothetical protein